MWTKTEEFLYLLLWTAETFSRPTWRNLTESFEGWAYRNGLHRQLSRLEERQLLEHQDRSTGARLYRLTEAGRLQALGGRDPERCWNRRWDGRWRLVLFDVPERSSTARDNLRRYLRNRGFGHLQNSVWITPDPLSNEREFLAGGPVDVGSLILLEARPAAGEKDAEIVAGAWDFSAINERFARHQSILRRFPRGPLDTEASLRTFQRWIAEERRAWLDAMTLDPLLPSSLLPPGYGGQEAWLTRRKVLAEAAEQLDTVSKIERTAGQNSTRSRGFLSKANNRYLSTPAARREKLPRTA